MIYEVQEVTAGVTIEDVVAAFKVLKRVLSLDTDFEVKWACMAA